MPRWRAHKPAPAPAEPVLALEPAPTDLDALRAYWRPVAQAMLQETDVPTHTVLDAYLGHLGLA